MTGFPFSSLPNLISLGRLILVPVIITGIANGQWDASFATFLLAGVSDGVDGFLAKRFGWQTPLGAYLDPVADKALLVSIYVALALAGVVPATLAILVVSRDVMIVGAIVIARLLDDPLEIRPLLVSKVNTTAQIAFAAAVLGAKAMGTSFAGWFEPCLVVVGALTLASAAAYLRQWLRYVLD